MDSAETRRELRVRIGRQRRRIDRRLRSVEREAGRLLSWRTYLMRYPAWALTVVGAGLTGAASLQRGRWPRRVDWRLFRRIGGMLWKRLMILPSATPDQEFHPSGEACGDGGENCGA